MVELVILYIAAVEADVEGRGADDQGNLRNWHRAYTHSRVGGRRLTLVRHAGKSKGRLVMALVVHYKIGGWSLLVSVPDRLHAGFESFELPRTTIPWAACRRRVAADSGRVPTRNRRGGI